MYIGQALVNLELDWNISALLWQKPKLQYLFESASDWDPVAVFDERVPIVF